LKFFVIWPGVKAGIYDAEAKIQHIFFERDKKNVEKFYTQCRDILHITIKAFEFFRVISGKANE